MFKRFIVRNNKSNLILFDVNRNILELKKQIIEDLKLDNTDFYLSYNGKLLNEKKTTNFYDIDNNSIIDINFRKRGGSIIAFLAIIGVLIVLAKPLISLIMIMGHMVIILFHVMGIFPPLLETVLLIFDPKRFVDDLIFGVSYGIKSLLSGMFSSINAGTSAKPNGSIDELSNIPKSCVSPTIFNLVLLIICPPLALFMDRGIQGMFLVIVCAILTVKLYYFPGLIFAALHILC